MNRARFLLLSAACLACLGTMPAARAQTDEKAFRAALAAKAAAEEGKVGAVEGVPRWYFVTAEWRMMSVGVFWGNAAAKVSRSSKPENADPLPAILDFNKQLKDRGIALLLVPVPPKTEIYPEKVAADLAPPAGDPDPALAAFYAELAKNGVDVLDLAPIFKANKAGAHGEVFCETDTHWSGAGCVLAAQAIAEKVRAKLGVSASPAKTYDSEWKEVSIYGDLSGMLTTEGVRGPAPEKIFVRQLKETLAPDPNSPLLLLGDSHTLVFHDFLAERAGLLDQLAVELGIVPDRIGVRGSGATPVRIDLYRRSLKEPGYLAKKKVVVWCFTAREFTEAAQGWQKLPVAK